MEKIIRGNIKIGNYYQEYINEEKIEGYLSINVENGNVIRLKSLTSVRDGITIYGKGKVILDNLIFTKHIILSDNTILEIPLLMKIDYIIIHYNSILIAPVLERIISTLKLKTDLEINLPKLHYICNLLMFEDSILTALKLIKISILQNQKKLFSVC